MYRGTWMSVGWHVQRIMRANGLLKGSVKHEKMHEYDLELTWMFVPLLRLCHDSKAQLC